MSLRYPGQKGREQDTVQISIASRIQEIPGLFDKFRLFADKHHLAEKVMDDMMLAVEEAVANIIHHGFADEKEHVIELRVSLADSILRVTITDDAVPFDPLRAPLPDLDVPLDQREPGGMGILLMKRMTDEMNYSRKEGKNVLELVKRVGSDPR